MDCSSDQFPIELIALSLRGHLRREPFDERNPVVAFLRFGIEWPFGAAIAGLCAKIGDQRPTILAALCDDLLRERVEQPQRGFARQSAPILVFLLHVLGLRSFRGCAKPF